MKDFRPQQWIDYWTKRYREQGVAYVARGGSQRSYHEQLKALTPFIEQNLTGSEFLDFGCGPGRFRKVLEAHGTYVGVDLLPEFGTVRLGTYLSTEAYDTVIAVMVMQHLVEEHIYVHWMEQIYKTLRPGGRFLVVDHNMVAHPGAHSNPRGPSTMQNLFRWRVVDFGFPHYDDHWMGVFTK